MGEGGVLHSILVTCRDCLHYDEAPAVYVSRRCDLGRWREAFPSASVVMYRLDVPRDCRDEVTQRLDGYGPWALDEATSEFVETGRPLTVREWDEGTRVRVMDGGEDPPDDAMGEDDDDGGLAGPLALPQLPRGVGHSPPPKRRRRRSCRQNIRLFYVYRTWSNPMDSVRPYSGTQPIVILLDLTLNLRGGCGWYDSRRSANHDEGQFSKI